MKQNKSIYQRINPETFAKMAYESREDIHALIEADKLKVERALRKSKWSEMFELSGRPAKDPNLYGK